MKRKLIQLLVITCIMGLVLVGCNNNDNNNNNDDNNNNNNNESRSSGAFGGGSSDDNNDDNDDSGFNSNANNDEIIDKLNDLYAEMYSMSPREYQEFVEASGTSPAEEFEEAANYMGISLQEFYEIEKVRIPNMTDEEKEYAMAMINAMAQLSDIDMPTEEEQEAAKDMIDAMKGDGNRIVEGDVRDLCYFRVDEVVFLDDDTEYGIYSLEYNSYADFEELFNYYNELLIDTPDSMIEKAYGFEVAILTGRIGEVDVYIMIDNEDGDDVVNVTVDSYEE